METPLSDSLSQLRIIKDNDEITLPPQDGRSRRSSDNDMILLHVLFLEGYCQVSWMQNELVQSPCFRDDNVFVIKRVWVTDPSFLRNSNQEEDWRPDFYGTKRALEEITSGRYHAIVVVDYSNTADYDEFQDIFGAILQQFVQKGGVVAFPSSESSLVSTLQTLFGVTWQRSNYFRTTWGPCPENEPWIRYSFGNGPLGQAILDPYSVKANTLRHVPVQERCFGVTTESRAQSLVPAMAAQDISRPRYDPDSVTAVAASHDDNGEDYYYDGLLEQDYDIIVAMHKYGQGCLAYFGDVNCEIKTCQLVAAFLLSRCPPHPIECTTRSRLDEQSFDRVQQLKALGNECFQNENINGALQYYTSALAIYQTCLGARGEQRDVLIALHSNMSLVYYKKKMLREAEASATKAIALDESHVKSLYRRGLVRYEMSLHRQEDESSASPSMDNLQRLYKSKRDLMNIPSPQDTRTRKDVRTLLAKIEKEMKSSEREQQNAFPMYGFTS